MEKEKELAARKALYEQYEKELDATEKRLAERAKQLNSMTMLLDNKCTNGVLLSMALLQKEIANKYFAMGYNRCKKHITIDVLNKNFPKSVDKQNAFLMETYFPHMSFESTYESEFRDKLLDPEVLRTYAGFMNEKVPEGKYFERKEK